MFDLIKFPCRTCDEDCLFRTFNFNSHPQHSPPPAYALPSITHKKCDPFQIFHWGWICNEKGKLLRLVRLFSHWNGKVSWRLLNFPSSRLSSSSTSALRLQVVCSTEVKRVSNSLNWVGLLVNLCHGYFIVSQCHWIFMNFYCHSRQWGLGTRVEETLENENLPFPLISY